MILFVGIVWSGILGYTFSALSYSAHNKQINTSDNFSLKTTQKAMEELYQILSTQYYETWSLDEAAMSRQSLVAFVGALGDPFTSYLPPQQAKELMDSVSGDETIEGIGALLSQTIKGIVIEEVTFWSPAAQEWLRPLDVIVQVDGTGVQNLPIDQVVGLIRWPKWTTVSITVLRMNDDTTTELITKTLTRDTIEIPSVTSKIITTKNGVKIGYIGLAAFAGDTERRLQNIIRHFTIQGIQATILDLRGDGGWLLSESVSVSSHFLPQNSIVTTAKYRVYNDDNYKTVWWGELEKLPLIVLINHYSASASEITALALRENRCPKSTQLSILESGSWSVFSDECSVLLMWQRSFWKWSVQSVVGLDFWGSLKLTIGKRFSPSWLSIDGKGILPDYPLELNEEEYYTSGVDNQLQKAQAVLSDYIISQK